MKNDKTISYPHDDSERKWVWHCSDKSLDKQQISILSLLETICALGLYFFSAQYFQHHWWLLLTAFAAPIILLRSDKSVRYGLELLKPYASGKKAEGSPEYKSIECTFIGVLFGFIFSYWLGQALPPVLVHLSVYQSRLSYLNFWTYRLYFQWGWACGCAAY